MKKTLTSSFENRQFRISNKIVTALSVVGGLVTLASCHSAPPTATKEAIREDRTTTAALVGGDGNAMASPASCTWDPREPGPNELFPATDGSPDYLRSVIPANPKL